MNLNLLKAEVQHFINKHLQKDVTEIALSKSPFLQISPKELAEQMDSKKRSEKKLPLWFNTQGVYFPSKLSVEQSSSESTAQYKNNLVKGDTLVDLTGGFGVDAFYFSKKIPEIFHIEQNEELSHIACYNSQVLGAENIRFVNSESISYLIQTDQSFDTIYIDPSRRIQTKKVFRLKDTEPDVVSNLPLLLSKAKRIIIKTSPLFDIQSGLKELSNVSEVHVISVKNDCKELLWVIDRDFYDEPEIISTAISNQSEKQFKFTLAKEKDIEIIQYSAPLQYLYEPDVALLKAGCFKSITMAFKVIKLHSNTHLYTSDNLEGAFIGKKLKVLRSIDYKNFTKEISIKKANVICRNFPNTPDEVKKRHKLLDGGEDYLIFTTAVFNQLMVIHATLI